MKKSVIPVILVFILLILASCTAKEEEPSAESRMTVTEEESVATEQTFVETETETEAETKTETETEQANAEEITIKAEDDLVYYLSDGVFLLPDEAKSVVFDGRFALPDMTFTSSVALTFKGAVTLSGELVISYAGDGVISIDASQNSVSLKDNIKIDAPGASLEWYGGVDIPDAEYVDKYYTVREYNGGKLDKNTGGDRGMYLQSLTANGISGGVDGFYVTFEVPYHASKINETSDISGLIPDGCTVELKKEEDRLYAVVSDGEKSCGYRVICKSKEYFLPLIYIDTENGKSVTSKTEYVKCSVTVNYNGYKESEDFEKVSGAPCLIRGRGNSSWKLDKKPYKLKFDSKTSLFGLTASKKWVLQSNHVDKSLMRNTVAMAIGAELTDMVFVPHSYLVDVFINGKYAGVYSLTEQIEIRDGRIDGEEDSELTDTDYLLELGEEENKTSFGSDTFSASLTLFAQIKSPDNDTLTKEQYDFIKDYVKKADKAVAALDGFEEYIDVDSLIDWFILQELSYNVDDSFRRSVFLLKKKDGKLYMASPWDFDYAFGNFYLDPDDPQGWICLGNELTDNYDEYIKTNWMDYLLKDETFKKKLKERWDQVSKKVLDAAESSINELKEKCAPSADSNFKAWKNVLGEKIQYEKRSTAKIATFDENVEFLRAFIEKRFEWMDKEIRSY